MTFDLKRILGAKVRVARELKGFSQERLAELIGRTPETISNIERGKTMPGVDTIQALCTTLGVRLADLLAEQNGTTGRAETEFRIMQMIRSLAQDDLRVVEKTVEALHSRPQKH